MSRKRKIAHFTASDVDASIVFAIDGEWDTTDFREFFYDFEYLYRFFALMKTHAIQSEIPEGMARESFFRSIDTAMTARVLATSLREAAVPRIVSIQFASPGSIVVRGIKSGIAGLLEVLSFATDKTFRSEYKQILLRQKEQEIEEKEQEILDRKLSNVCRVLELQGPSSRDRELKEFIKDRIVPKLTGLEKSSRAKRITSASMKDDMPSASHKTVKSE